MAQRDQNGLSFARPESALQVDPERTPVQGFHHFPRALRPTCSWHFRVGAAKIVATMADARDYFAEAEARQKELLKRLALAPVVDVVGVVGASAPSGSQSGGEKLWSLLFDFQVWRTKSTGLQTQPLIIRRKVTMEELHRWQESINPYTVIRIKARVVVGADEDGHQALLEDFVGRESSDEELNRHLKQLQQPVTFEDPSLGTFTLDRRVDWFSGTVAWEGHPISLNLSGSETHKVLDALKTAHALWKSPNTWNRRIRDYAVEKLLPLKNESWLDENEPALTPDEFRARMTLQSITVYPDGSFDFWHNDGDLFWGHSIHISGSLANGPTGADIPG